MSWYRMELYIVTAYFGDASIFGDDEDVSRDVGDDAEIPCSQNL